ncbi:hypothetical protein PsorP6_016667 [Peronosclerospora sorghi]|uniref:Uncharacterized protein n=1 Tax=Peronosclerospora sorghi TaxID=230839 RepID=A0ACC0VRC9_9STRA|nr:hypothetical protein PsorP6_016667 [Peronosclerospora sorghi]
MSTRVLLIDNYDSFTYNIFQNETYFFMQYMAQLGAQVEVKRNDQVTVDEIHKMQPDRIMISPGPGYPKDAGVSCAVILAFAGKIPIAGICLGHQCVYEVFGGKVDHAGEIVHGKASLMVHDGKGLFKGIAPEFKAIRYHSLVGLPETLPDVLEVTATVKDTNMIMGVRHKEHKIEGWQFHPESILTENGLKLIRNFLEM